MRMTRSTLIVISAVIATGLLAGCSSNNSMPDMPGMDGGDTGSSASAAVFNDADVTFVEGMIPHHTQAVEMSTMLLAKTGIDPRVVDLATRIKTAQGPEITAMNSWLVQWGNPADPMAGMDMGGGMMSDADMAALDAATGLEASKLFLTQMTVHHASAIEQAKAEKAAGKNGDALALADGIVSSQSAEITEMAGLLATL